MNRYKKKILFDPPVVGFFLNPLFFTRRCLADAIASRSHHIRGSIIDIGCGSKPYVDFFDVSSYFGVDVPVSGHDHTASEVDCFFDGYSLPFKDDSFDNAICFEVLEHASDPDLLLREISRVLKPGGVLVLTVPFLWCEHEVPFDFQRYTAEGLKYKLLKNEFSVLSIQKIGPGAGILFQIFVVYALSLMPSKLFSRIMYAAAFSIPLLIFYLLSRVYTADDSIYANLIAEAKNIVIPSVETRNTFNDNE